jgi:hypothetical protein
LVKEMLVVHRSLEELNLQAAFAGSFARVREEMGTAMLP